MLTTKPAATQLQLQFLQYNISAADPLLNRKFEISCKMHSKIVLSKNIKICVGKFIVRRRSLDDFSGLEIGTHERFTMNFFILSEIGGLVLGCVLPGKYQLN